MLLLYALNDFCMTGEFRPVFSGPQAPGIPSGSMGAFLVLESPEHATARGGQAHRQAFRRLVRTGASG